ncbi:hypothetical protein BuS5_02271 [Desulfosarcina sp. BuS5]|nr:hypothetical protein BuS5_02271 [Desulfosarcina sp. BuS5]
MYIKYTDATKEASEKFQCKRDDAVFNIVDFNFPIKLISQLSGLIFLKDNEFNRLK